MSFMDKVKDAGEKASKSASASIEQHQERVSERKDARGNKIQTMMVEYLGGYGDYKKAKGKLAFYEKQVEFNSPLSTKFVVSVDDMQKVAIEGKDEVGRRVTVTRLLVLNVFALAFMKKRKDKESYITLELDDGQEVIFHVEKMAPMTLKAQLAPLLIPKKKSLAPSSPDAPQGVADELLKLSELKKQGVLSAEEFEEQKAKLLKGSL